MIVNTQQRAVRAGMNARKSGTFETESSTIMPCYLDSFQKGWQLQNSIMLLGNPEERFLAKSSVDEIDLGEPNKSCRPLQRSRTFEIYNRPQIILKTLREHTGFSDNAIINMLLDSLGEVAVNIKKQSEGKSL